MHIDFTLLAQAKISKDTLTKQYINPNIPQLVRLFEGDRLCANLGAFKTRDWADEYWDIYNERVVYRGVSAGVFNTNEPLFVSISIPLQNLFVGKIKNDKTIFYEFKGSIERV